MLNLKNLLAISISLTALILSSGCATVYKLATTGGKSRLDIQNTTMYSDLLVYENGNARQIRREGNDMINFSHANDLYYLLVDRNSEHTLTLESKGKQAEVTVKPYCAWWPLIWFEGPLLVVDKITGGCHEFEGVDVSSALATGRFVIFSAIEKKEKERLKKMLAVNRDLVNKRDRDGQTPLHSAIASGDPEIVEILLSHQPDVNAKAKGQTALQFASNLESKAPGKYDKIIELLRSKGGQ